eukprot:5785887-Amphidinium_carterae.1
MGGRGQSSFAGIGLRQTLTSQCVQHCLLVWNILVSTLALLPRLQGTSAFGTDNQLEAKHLPLPATATVVPKTRVLLHAKERTCDGYGSVFVLRKG